MTTGTGRPSWLDEVQRAVDAERRRVRRTAGPATVGEAREVAGPAGVLRTFEVRARGHRADVDGATGYVLVPAGTETGERDQAFEVAEILGQEGECLRLRAAAPPDVRLVLQPRTDPPSALDALHTALAPLTDPGLAAGLVARPSRRRRAQAGSGRAAAVEATLAPGLNVVWAPAGGGTARVLAAVLRQVVAQGQSALLVSNTGRAVDRALAETLEGMPARPGQLVRVGHPSQAEVARHPTLPLDAAARLRAPELAGALADVEERYSGLSADPELREVAELERELRGIDYVALEAAEGRIANAERARAVARDLAAAQDTLRSWDRELAEAERLRADAQAELDSVRSTLRYFHDDAALRDELETLERLRDAARRDEEDTARGGSGRRKLRRRVLGARVRAAEAEAALVRARVRALGLRPHIPSQTLDAADERLDAVLACSQQVEALKRQRRRQQGRVAALAEHLARVQRLPQPEQAHHDLVRWSREERVPERLADLDARRQATADLREELQGLAAEHERLRAQLRQQESAVIAQAQVVGATLTALATRQQLADRRYDYVLVEDASTALPPFLVLAASRADRGVTFLGDFRQSPPVTAHEQPGDGDDPVIRRWLQQDVFGLLGIAAPERAAADTRCTLLLDEQRLGTTITDLVNLVAYEGRLPAADPPSDAPGVTLVDVRGLGGVATVRRGQGRGDAWWPVGALLSVAIAQRHERAGRSVGIVTLAHRQRETITALVADSDLDAEVGTVQQYQGRVLPIVVCDLVEDGRGWVSRASKEKGRWELRALRLFTAAVTRASEQLYLIVNGEALDRAETGPLAALRALRDAGRVPQVPARDWLAGDELKAVGTIEFVPGVQTSETRGLYPALRGSYDACKEDLWIWSPALGNQMNDVLPHLHAAVERGVRVTVFVKPAHERDADHADRVTRLRQAGPRVVEVAGTHEKLAVADGALSFVGTLGSRARRGDRDETLVFVRGRAFAARLLADHSAELLAAEDHRCARHPGATCYAQQFEQRRKRGWFWRCPEPGCDEERPIVPPAV